MAHMPPAAFDIFVTRNLDLSLKNLRELRFQCYAPKGVHVCHVVLDGVIASPNTKGWASKVAFFVEFS